MGVTTSWYAVPHRLSVARILRLRGADRPAAEAALLEALAGLRPLAEVGLRPDQVRSLSVDGYWPDCLNIVAALLLALDPDSAYARIRRDSPHSPIAAGQEVPRLQIRRGLPIGAPGWLVEGEWWAGNPSPPPTEHVQALLRYGPALLAEAVARHTGAADATTRYETTAVADRAGLGPILTPTGLARLGADVTDLLPDLPLAGPAWGERVADLAAVWGHTMRLLAFLTDARLERGADGQWVCRADAVVRVTR